MKYPRDRTECKGRSYPPAEGRAGVPPLLSSHSQHAATNRPRPQAGGGMAWPKPRPPEKHPTQSIPEGTCDFTKKYTGRSSQAPSQSQVDKGRRRRLKSRGLAARALERRGHQGRRLA